MRRLSRRWFRRLFFGWRLGESLFLFDGDVAKLCRIKYFSACLALNEFGVFLAGDDLDDGMFAFGGHFGEDFANGMDFARLGPPCQLSFGVFLRSKIVVSWWRICGELRGAAWLQCRGR